MVSMNRKRIITICGFIVFFISIAVILGWFFHVSLLVSILPGYATMKFNAALCFLFSSIGLLTSVQSNYFGLNKIRLSMTLLVFVISLLTLLEYILEQNFGIDQIFVSDLMADGHSSHLGRMPANAALGFFLLSFFQFLSPKKIRRSHKAVQKFIQIVGFIFFSIIALALLGYMFNAQFHYGFAAQNQMAIHTVFSFFILGFANILKMISQEAFKILSGKTIGSYIFRQLIVPALIMPILVGWASLWLVKSGIFDIAYCMSIMAVATICVFSYAIWKSANSANRQSKEFSEAQRQLQNKEAQLFAIINHAPIILACVNREGIYTAFAGKALEDIGLKPNQVIGQSILERHKNNPTIYNVMTRALRGESFSQIIDFQDRVFECNYSPIINDGSPNGFVAVTTDITEKKFFQATQIAAESAKMKSDFLANMSHEIRTPINGIMGMASLLSDTSLNQNQKEYLDSITQSADSLLIIINDILDFSKIEAGKLEFEEVDFDLIKIIREIETIMSLQTRKKGLALNVELHPNLPFILKGDPGRLRQVFNNLIGNAIKFTQSGSITIRARLLHKHEKEARLRFEIIDTGIGIPESAKTKMFQAFSQADASTARHFGGSGLGLSISKQLVEKMKGNIGVESQQHQGSVFWFEITFKHEVTQVENQDEEWVINISEKLLRPMRVLIAEDNLTNLKIAMRYVEDIGLRADVVGNGSEVLDALREIPYDLILMDCQMPGMDGFQATRTIRRSLTLPNPHIPIIAMTANAFKEDREKCIAVGMDDYISKPVRIEDLSNMLFKWLVQQNKKAFSAEPIIDLEVISRLKKLDRKGESSFTKELIDSFIMSTAESIEHMKKNCEMSREPEIIYGAHQLKSSSANLGAIRFSKLCINLEEQAKNKNFEATTFLLDNLDIEYKLVASELSDITKSLFTSIV